jgi:F-type H+-transporting ATPase subunit gamma
MAGGQERILRRRIRSVESTKKITRAMELIAASRIVKAQARVEAAQPYAEGITDVVRNLQSAGGGSNSPLLTPRDEVRKVANIVMSADRGLCGGYNSTVIRATEQDMRVQEASGRANMLVTVGRKAEAYFRFRDYPIDAAYSGFSDNPSYENARAVASAVVDAFAAGDLDRVQLVYTKFVSAGRQEVVVEPLLPLEASEQEAPAATEHATAEPAADYEYEPNPDAILETLLPRYTESRIYAALLNAAASEHASRQRAMKAATDNAEELILTYRRRMNRARQDSITTEIMEIVGGAEALSQGAEQHDSHAAEYYDKSA